MWFGRIVTLQRVAAMEWPQGRRPIEPCCLTPAHQLRSAAGRARRICRRVSRLGSCMRWFGGTAPVPDLQWRDSPDREPPR